MTASTCNDSNHATGSADYDTKISIFCADCEDMTCVAGQDDGSGCAGFSTNLSWASQAGATYLILVHSFNGQVGNFELAILDDGVPIVADVVCEVYIEVDIDIKPWSDPNSINLKSKGVISVAILTTEDFDATTVDPLSAEFGPNGAVEACGKGHIEDVDDDGDLDLLLHFNKQEADIACGDIEAVLTGETFDGMEIEGFDSVNIVRCN